MRWHEKLKFARRVKDISFQDVEKATGLSNQYLCQMEDGKAAEPSIYKMTKLLDLYNMNMDDIMDINED